MPTEVKKRSGGPIQAEPVRPGESWRQYVNRLRGASAFGASQMAGIVSATVLMGKNPDAPANGRMLEALSQRITKQSSFRYVTRDPESLRLARSGKGAEVIVRMGERKRREEEMLRKYRRDSSKVKSDAVFFQNVTKSIKDSFANHSAAQQERESRRYLEMLKQLDHARSLAEQGIALDGKSARELAQAVQSYNDGGGKTPGGKKPAAASKEALCVLKRVMPEEEFNDYCSSINRTHKADSPAHRRYVDPKAYTEELVNGGAKTARDVMLATQRQFSKGMTLEGCALATAVMKLSRGNPNAVISKSALETEVAKMKQPGSAFLRAMSDEKARAKYAELAHEGKLAGMGRTILRDAKAHSIRSAQWQIRQAQGAMAKDGSGASVDKLATILAARSMAASADTDQNITNSAFKAKTEEIRSSAAFAALASQYQSDRSFRDRINEGLEKGDGGKALEQEYQKMNSPQKEKQTELPQPVLKSDAKG